MLQIRRDLIKNIPPYKENSRLREIWNNSRDEYIYIMNPIYRYTHTQLKMIEFGNTLSLIIDEKNICIHLYIEYNEVLYIC